MSSTMRLLGNDAWLAPPPSNFSSFSASAGHLGIYFESSIHVSMSPNCRSCRRLLATQSIHRCPRYTVVEASNEG